MIIIPRQQDTAYARIDHELPAGGQGSVLLYEEVVVIGDYLDVPAPEHSNRQACVIARRHTRSAHVVYVKAVIVP